MADDSLDLLGRMQRGDTQALDTLLRQHLPGLRGFVRLHSGALLRSKEASTDLVQSVCLEILQHLDRFQFPSEAGFRQWLYVTALRKIKDRYDYYLAVKRDAGREVPADKAQADLLDCYRSFCTPSQVVAAREEIQRVESAFDLLSEEQRQVILLAHVVGLSRAEIGARTGRKEGAVRTLLSRAIARLTELLDEEG